MSAWNRRFETRCSETILVFSWPIVPVSPLARSFRELITKHCSWSSKLYLVGFLTQRRSSEHSTCSQLIFTGRSPPGVRAQSEVRVVAAYRPFASPPRSYPCDLGVVETEGLSITVQVVPVTLSRTCWSILAPAVF